MKRSRTLRLAHAAGALALAACASQKPHELLRRDPSAAPAAAEPSAAPADAAAPAEAHADLPTSAPPAVPDLTDMRITAGEQSAESVFQWYGTNPTIDTSEEPASTFAVDVDTASYGVARAYLRNDQLPPPEAIRVEEVQNAIRYGWAPPKSAPFSVVAEAFPSPNRTGYHVLMLGLRGRLVPDSERAPAHLVLVVDESGSMADGDRISLVRRGIASLARRLRADDTLAIVGYGDVARVVLPTTSARDVAAIEEAVRELSPQGSTNVQAGVMLGLDIANAARPGSLRRVIVCSDGMANSGIADADEIFDAVSQHAQRGVHLSTIGVGMGNYNDVVMERLAVRGQGRYRFVDDAAAADRVFAGDLVGALVVVAHDAKVQVELDPRSVSRYRLIGFENRKLARRDLQDDSKDGGEIGAGHEMTALYEVKLLPGADRIGWLRIRSKSARGAASELLEVPLEASLVRKGFALASAESRLAWVASAYGEKLRGSYWARTLSWDTVIQHWQALPVELRAHDDVKDLGDLIRRARSLDQRPDRFERDTPVAEMSFDELPRARHR